MKTNKEKIFQNVLYVEKMYYICHVRNNKQMYNNLNDRTMSDIKLAFTRKQLQMAEWSRKFDRLFDMPLECFIDRIFYKAGFPWFDLIKFEDNLVAEEEWDEDQYSTAEIVEMRYGKEARQLIEELIDAR